MGLISVRLFLESWMRQEKRSQTRFLMSETPNTTIGYGKLPRLLGRCFPSAVFHLVPRVPTTGATAYPSTKSGSTSQTLNVDGTRNWGPNSFSRCLEEST